MPVVEELWNNTTSPCKKFHKKIKWFSIFIKPNKCRKLEKKNKTGKRLPGPYLRPGTMRPGRAAQPTGRASHLLARARRTSAWLARASTRPGHLLPACFIPDASRRRHALPSTLSHSPPCSPPRTASSPPLAVAMATGHSTPCR